MEKWNERKNTLKRMLTSDLRADEHKAIKTAISAIESWERLEAGIAEMKRKQNSSNSDYKTGFICALSNIEGLMAVIRNDT